MHSLHDLRDQGRRTGKKKEHEDEEEDEGRNDAEKEIAYMLF